MKKWWVILIIISILILYLFTVNPRPASTSSYSSDDLSKNSFVGDQQCQSCHQQEHNDWKTSDHFKAMLAPNDSTVKGDFNNAIYSADGVSSRFFKKGEDFYINTQGPDGRNHDYKVAYTFGHYPLQQYLVEFPGGRMQVPRVSWDVKEKKWFHQYKGQKIAHADWLHWTGDAQNWNTMCAACHSTNLQKNYNIDQDTFRTTYSSINVSCESCHGAGKLHVDFVRTEKFKKGNKSTRYFLNKGNTQAEQLITCAPCHALRGEISNSLIESEELMDNYIPQLPTTEHFFADGQIKDEDYIYSSFLQSKMKHRGVTCSSCHNAHTGSVLFVSNQLCSQCHSQSYDSPSHHFHQINTAGADCKSCHMPGKTYMGNDYRHDHSFRVPRPDQSVKYGIPNACTSCHTDKSNEWAAAAVVKHFGKERKYHFSDDLIPGSQLDAGSEIHLIKLLKDTSTPAIIKATALHYLGSILTSSSLAALVGELQNEDAMIRYNALRGLANFSPDSWRNVAGSLLADKVRAVRIAAADLFLTLPAHQIPENYHPAFNQARKELKNYLLHQADFADGNVMIGDHYLRISDYQNAEKFYLRALKKDSLLNYTRLNLAVTYSATGRNKEALNVLKTAAAISPENDRVHFNLGLLYTEMKDTAAAIHSFNKGVQLNTQNPRLYYNYGLLLFHKKQVSKAEIMLKKGLALSPGDDDLLMALQYILNSP